MQGNVSLRPNSAWWRQSAAVMNAPIMKDGILTTGDNSQAEIQFDGVNLLVRVAPGSGNTHGRSAISSLPGAVLW